MKKRLFSLMLAALMLFGMLPCAYAENIQNTQYLNLSSATAGEYVDRVICSIDGASDFDCTPNELPQGCSVILEVKDEVPQLVLRGIPTQTGSFNFTLLVKDGAQSIIAKLVCSFTVKSAAPTVSTGPSLTVFVNDNAFISCSGVSPDGAPVSYQWYSSPYNINYGGTAIDGAVKQSYHPDTSKAGTRYYYCVVSNSAASTASDVVIVTVQELTASSIAVVSNPTKLKYKPGENLDIAGLSILVTYANGVTETISDGFGVYPTKLDAAGKQKITVSYKGCNCTFEVEVEEEEKVESIEILNKPLKLSYKVGERLDATGLILKVKTNKEDKKITVGYTCSPKVLDKEGTQTITVTYEGKTCTFDVKVESDKEKLENIMISSLPTKRSYKVGEALDTSGLKISLITDKGTKTDVTSGFTCSPTYFDKKGSQIVTVTYEGKTCSFTVNVAEADKPAETPKPSDSPDTDESPEVIVVPTTAPQTPTPTPAVRPSKNGPSRGFLWVIMAVALLGLAGIVVYFILTNRPRDGESPEDDDDDEPDNNFPQNN